VRKIATKDTEMGVKPRENSGSLRKRTNKVSEGTLDGNDLSVKI